MRSTYHANDSDSSLLVCIEILELRVHHEDGIKSSIPGRVIHFLFLMSVKIYKTFLEIRKKRISRDQKL